MPCPEEFFVYFSPLYFHTPIVPYHFLRKYAVKKTYFFRFHYGIFPKKEYYDKETSYIRYKASIMLHSWYRFYKKS